MSISVDGKRYLFDNISKPKNEDIELILEELSNKLGIDNISEYQIGNTNINTQNDIDILIESNRIDDYYDKLENLEIVESIVAENNIISTKIKIPNKDKYIQTDFMFTHHKKWTQAFCSSFNSKLKTAHRNDLIRTLCLFNTIVDDDVIYLFEYDMVWGLLLTKKTYGLKIESKLLQQTYDDNEIVDIIVKRNEENDYNVSLESFETVWDYISNNYTVEEIEEIALTFANFVIRNHQYNEHLPTIIQEKIQHLKSNKLEMLMCCGVSGSGKTTWIKNNLSTKKENIISLDDFLYYKMEKENISYQESYDNYRISGEHYLADKFSNIMAKQQNIVIDRTLLTKRERRYYIDLVGLYYDITLCYFKISDKTLEEITAYKTLLSINNNNIEEPTNNGQYKIINIIRRD